MVDVLFIVAVVSFALAACLMVACVIIFFRMQVLDAIRFLQHKPTVSSGRRSGKTQSEKKNTKESRKKKQEKSLPVQPDSEDDTDLLKKGKMKDASGDTTPIATSGAILGDTSANSEESENTTELIAQDSSEHPTGLLDQEASENPTGLLDQEASENPTGMLAPADSENPTGILVERRSSGLTNHLPQDSSEYWEDSLDEEDSEYPTGRLVDEASERPTGVLIPTENGASHQEATAISGETDVVQQEKSLFRFMLTHNEIVVHTRETIA